MSFSVENDASNVGGQSLFNLEDTVGSAVFGACYSTSNPPSLVDSKNFLTLSNDQWSAPNELNHPFNQHWSRDGSSNSLFSGSGVLSKSGASFFQQVMSSSASSLTSEEGSPDHRHPLFVPIKTEPIEVAVLPSLMAHESLDSVKSEPSDVAFKPDFSCDGPHLLEAPLAPLDHDMDSDDTIEESSTSEMDVTVSEIEGGPRHQFRVNVAAPLYEELLAGELSYDELIEKYKRKFPEHSNRFTKNFLTKLRTGRVCNAVTGLTKRQVKAGAPKMRRVTKISATRSWAKMTDEIFEQILAQERITGTLKREVLENTFNVNRTTYYRWKKQRGIY